MTYPSGASEFTAGGMEACVCFASSAGSNWTSCRYELNEVGAGYIIVTSIVYCTTRRIHK